MTHILLLFVCTIDSPVREKGLIDMLADLNEQFLTSSLDDRNYPHPQQYSNALHQMRVIL